MKVLFCSIYFIFIFIIDSYSQTNLNSTEKMLVGNWKLIDYKDNIERSDSAQKVFERDIQFQKKMTLAINNDFTYYRELGKQSEAGNWKISRNRKSFITKPKDLPKKKLGLVELTEEKMTLRIVEEGITTLITWEKEKP